MEVLVSLIYKKNKKQPPPPTRGRTRSDLKSNFKLPAPKLTLYKKSPTYRGKKLWNKMPHFIQLSETKEIFKARTKVWFGTNMKGKRALLLGKRKSRQPP